MEHEVTLDWAAKSRVSRKRRDNPREFGPGLEGTRACRIRSWRKIEL